MTTSFSNKTGKLTEATQLQTDDEYSKLLANLKGQTVIVPDLRPMFSSWPTGRNPDQATLATMMVTLGLEVTKAHPFIPLTTS